MDDDAIDEETRVVDRFVQLFPQTEHWFEIVASGSYTVSASGRLVPEHDTLTHERVRWSDGAGHTVVPELARRFRETSRIRNGQGGGRWVDIKPLGGRDVRAEIQQGVVTYRNAYEDTHVAYKSTPTHVDEYFLLQSRDAPTRWRYRVRTGPGLARVRQAGNSIEAVDEDRVAWLRANPPRAVDRHGTQATGTIRVRDGIIEVAIDVSHLDLPIMVDPDWRSTGDMAYGRFYHGAEVLPSGRMLVTGGCSASVCSGDLTLPSCRTVVSAAESFDPDSRTFSRSADASTRRYLHASESLPGGSVLIAGGCTNPECTEVTASAEVYDPASKSFHGVDPIDEAGAGPVSASLPDGRVLVAGGCTGAGCTSRAWVFDPSTETFTEVAPMMEARGRASATVLQDGRVLVAGGCASVACAEVLSSAEIYDPERDQWAQPPPMRVARAAHYAAPPRDGRVLIGGGCADQSCNIVHQSAELFVVRRGEFVDAAMQNEPRFGARAERLPDGRVLVSQGCASSSDCGLTNEAFDPATGTFAQVSSAVTVRAFHRLVLLPGAEQVIANGGCQPGTCSWWNETYDVSSLGPVADDAGMRDGSVVDGAVVDGAVGRGRDGAIGDAGRPERDSGSRSRDAGARISGDGSGCGCRVLTTRERSRWPMLGLMVTVWIGWRRRR